jgi:hypothetical protein
MASLTRATGAALAAAGLLTLGGGAYAQTATQADFDACNRMGQAATVHSGAGGFTASSGSVGTGGPMSMSSGAGAPSTDANRQINSSGRVSSSAGSPGTNSGTTSSGAAGMPSASPRTSATDPQLTGMDATGHGSAAYQQAYRDCMKQRGY